MFKKNSIVIEQWLCFPEYLAAVSFILADFLYKENAVIFTCILFWQIPNMIAFQSNVTFWTPQPPPYYYFFVPIKWINDRSVIFRRWFTDTEMSACANIWLHPSVINEWIWLLKIKVKGKDWVHEHTSLTTQINTLFSMTLSTCTWEHVQGFHLFMCFIMWVIRAYQQQILPSRQVHVL